MRNKLKFPEKQKLQKLKRNAIDSSSSGNERTSTALKFNKASSVSSDDTLH